LSWRVRDGGAVRISGLLAAMQVSKRDVTALIGMDTDKEEEGQK
jgi:hypothetical protein